VVTTDNFLLTAAKYHISFRCSLLFLFNGRCWKMFTYFIVYRIHWLSKGYHSFKHMILLQVIISPRITYSWLEEVFWPSCLSLYCVLKYLLCRQVNSS